MSFDINIRKYVNEFDEHEASCCEERERIDGKQNPLEYRNRTQLSIIRLKKNM